MLTEYIEAAMKKAKYKILEDATYFGEIPDFPGVWADESTLEDCRRVLREVLEDWLLLKLRDDEEVPEVDGLNLSRRPVKA